MEMEGGKGKKVLDSLDSLDVSPIIRLLVSNPRETEE